MVDGAVQDDRFRAGKVLGRGFDVFFGNFLPYSVLAALFLLPAAMLEQIRPESFSASIVRFAAETLIAGTLAFATLAELEGRRIALALAARRGLDAGLRVLKVAFVTGIVTIAGLLLLVVPGAIFATVVWVAIPVAAVEKCGINDSIRRSADLTRGHRWPVLGIIVLVLLIEVVAFSLGALWPLAADIPVLNVFVALALTGPATALSAVIAAVGYHHLRWLKDGIGTDEITEVFA